ncbi:MAG: sigma-70 family RNA polymerase sigma factor [Ruminococcus sp.]|nr:sigma-70 family RNA polymerase sigma factor [Ruminococcus sp.]
MSQMLTKTEKAEQIVRQHADMIYRIALQNLKNKADAEDIFQDVCMTLLTKDAPLFDDVHLKHWLIRVTINKCKNFKKSLWQRKTEPLNVQPDSGLDSGGVEVLELLYTVPKQYRNIVYLYYFEEYTVPEIAMILGENKNTVNSKLQRARKRLRKILEEGDDE